MPCRRIAFVPSSIRCFMEFTYKVALESPTQDSTVVAAAEGPKKTLSRPVQPKKPLKLETVVKIFTFYNTASASLADI